MKSIHEYFVLFENGNKNDTRILGPIKIKTSVGFIPVAFNGFEFARSMLLKLGFWDLEIISVSEWIERDTKNSQNHLILVEDENEFNQIRGKSGSDQILDHIVNIVDLKKKI